MIDRRLQRVAEALLPHRSFEKARWHAPATLSVVCDDGYLQDRTVIASLLESYGAKGTFAICSDLIGQPGYLGESDLADLIRRGHDIASHMQRHVSITTLNSATCLGEMQDSKDWLLARGAHTQTLVYPFGRNSRSTRARAAQHFSCAMSAWPGINVGAVNAFALRRFAFGSHESAQLPISSDPARWLDQTCANQGWLVVMLHSGDPQRVADHDQRVDRLLREAQSRGMHIKTVAAACAAGLIKTGSPGDVAVLRAAREQGRGAASASHLDGLS